MDHVPAPVDLPRTDVVLCTQAALRRVQARAALLRARQNGLIAGGRDLLGSRRSVTLSLIMFSRSTRGHAFFLIAASLAFAQTPQEPPKVLRITRQIVKPGRAVAQERIGTLAAHAMARTKYPANVLALSSVSGESE